MSDIEKRMAKALLLAAGIPSREADGIVAAYSVDTSDESGEFWRVPAFERLRAAYARPYRHPRPMQVQAVAR